MRYCSCATPWVNTRPSGQPYCAVCGLNVAPPEPPQDEKP